MVESYKFERKEVGVRVGIFVLFYQKKLETGLEISDLLPDGLFELLFT